VYERRTVGNHGPRDRDEVLSSSTDYPRGRAKRCYRVEALGEFALQESAVTAKRIWDVIEEVSGKERAKEWGKQEG
jgi:hypothetical protein